MRPGGPSVAMCQVHSSSAGVTDLKRTDKINPPEGAEGKPARGGKRPGAGQKPLYGTRMAQVSVRLTTAQRDTLTRLGGAQWLRQYLDRMRQRRR